MFYEKSMSSNRVSGISSDRDCPLVLLISSFSISFQLYSISLFPSVILLLSGDYAKYSTFFR